MTNKKKHEEMGCHLFMLLFNSSLDRRQPLQDLRLVLIFAYLTLNLTLDHRYLLQTQHQPH